MQYAPSRFLKVAALPPSWKLPPLSHPPSASARVSAWPSPTLLAAHISPWVSLTTWEMGVQFTRSRECQTTNPGAWE
jgi:hypothetical protein